MVSWGTVDVASNSVQWAARTIQAGSGPANISSNNTALYENTTPEAFNSTNMAIGQFAFTGAEFANGGAEDAKVPAPGWNLRRAWEGPVTSITVANGYFQNGETLTVSNGSVNASASLTTNATGNLVSASVITGGRFVNSSVLAFSFDRQLHLSKLTATGGSAAYSNTDYIIAANGINNANVAVTTNATGYITNTTLATTLAAATQLGLWSNTFANTNVSLTIYAANGSASNGAGATLVANLSPSTGGAASAVLGGRAGRVKYETLVFVHNITSGNTSSLLPS